MAKGTIDFGGSPAKPYFGGREEEVAAARAENRRVAQAEAERERTKQRKTETVRTNAEDAATSAKQLAEVTPEEAVARRDATAVDTEGHKPKSADRRKNVRTRNAAETGQSEPVGDPDVRQPGTEPKAPHGS